MIASSGTHTDPVAPILLALMLISVGAALAGRWMRKLGQSAVLGELLIGMLVANVAYALHEPIITVLREGETISSVFRNALSQNVSAAEAARSLLPDSDSARRVVEVLQSPHGTTAISIHLFLDLLSRLAVIVLLFLVGLETNFHEMRRVSRVAFLVAFVGVVLPFFLGVGSMAVLSPNAPLQNDIFIGAILTATSVGITARVFRDLRQSHRPEANIILGAAVIDDVLGLVILAVVSGLVVTGTISFGAAAWITGKAVLFLVAVLGLGMWLTPHLARRVSRLDIHHQKLFFGLGLAFLLSWLATISGLATIVGAFAAGLILEELLLKDFPGQPLREILSPLESLIVPVFFVLMGMQVKLETFLQPGVALTAGALTLAAIIGKLASGYVAGARLDHLSVGIGMMPRGEVGLIFAGIGKGLGVVTDSIFSAVVIMVMVTTFLTPPLLKITLARSENK